MRRIAVFAVVMLATAMAGHAAAEPQHGLTVRVYNSVDIPSIQVLGARLVAGPILRDAGMDVTIRQCGGPALPTGPMDPCSDRPDPREVIVRIIDAPHFSLTLRPEVFGAATLIRGTQQSRFITLYADRIAGAAYRVGVETGTLLGRVLAHEVGHILLGTHYHGETGVMRADWPDELLQRKAPKEWRFSLHEAETMQSHLAASLGE